ncbi:MAG: hypothetical protein PVS2B3_00810 [Steroidobacteraceae bacterium]
MLAVDPLKGAGVSGPGALHEPRLPVDPFGLCLRRCHLIVGARDGAAGLGRGATVRNVADLQQVFPELQARYARLRHMNPYRALQRIWQPGALALGNLALENPAAVLGKHWRSAKVHVEQLFWGTPISWLECRPAQTRPLIPAPLPLHERR